MALVSCNLTDVYISLEVGWKCSGGVYAIPIRTINISCCDETGNDHLCKTGNVQVQGRIMF